jgi:hypothetical protein
MKANFKPLGLVAAVAAVTAGYTGVAGAHPERAIGNLGDLAIIPYYTVQDDWVTGVHIINSSALTQVVKLRLRRGSDSADALDFNLIMSPQDEWTGFIDDSSGDIVFATDDTTCTAPIREDGRFPMPAIYRAGAEEGYIEVIGMGSPDPAIVNAFGAEGSAIAIAAKHSDGVPANCSGVASNFFANAGASPFGRGVMTNSLTHQTVSAAEAAVATANGQDCFTAAGAGPMVAPNFSAGVCQNEYESGSDSLKVSYFFRDAASGIEFGGDAVHLTGFSADAWMTNQETGLFSGDVFGFDFPDLDGGPWDPSGGLSLRGKYNDLRDGGVLGVASVLNDWSTASSRNVSTDWVLTMPGQYAMLDIFTWLQSGFGATCGRAEIQATGVTPVPECDFRDLPVQLVPTAYDREEFTPTPEDGDLVISPAPPGSTTRIILPNEVNVLEWTDGANTPVLGSQYNTVINASAVGESGWAIGSVSSLNTNARSVCQLDGTTDVVPGTGVTGVPAVFTAGGPSYQRPGVCIPATGNVPVVGFVAWERSFPQNPEGNYGRLIDHSFIAGASTSAP